MSTPNSNVDLEDIYTDSLLNLALIDPPRWGWAALGGVKELISPHERARRKTSKVEFLKALSEQKLKEKNLLQHQSTETKLTTNDAKPPPAIEASATQTKESSTTSLVDDQSLLQSDGGNIPSDAVDSNTTTINTIPQPVSESNNNDVDIEMKNTLERNPSSEIPIENQQKVEHSTSLQDITTTTTIPMENTCVEENKIQKPLDDGINKHNLSEEYYTLEKIVPKSNNDKDAKNNDENNEDLVNEDESSNHTKKKKKDVKSKSTGKDTLIKIKHINENNELNIHSYHRGVMGQEPRDCTTGNLLCPYEPTDTLGHWLENPKYKLKVKVEFPLCDVEDYYNADEIKQLLEYNSEEPVSSRRRRLDGSEQKSKVDILLDRQRRYREMQAELPHFRDEIIWDLSDPTTPSPMLWAHNIATEFGLSFCQMLDLATSVQSQIDSFITENLHYETPMTIMDPTTGMPRDSSTKPSGFITPKTLYGGHLARSLTHVQKIPSSQKDLSKTAKMNGKTRVPDAAPLSSSSSSKRRRDSSSKPRPKPKPSLPPVGDDVVIEDEYVDEVMRRGRLESTAMITKLGEDSGDTVGKLKIVDNFNCHICHVRKPKGIVFACIYDRHNYCDNHCQTRLDFSVADVRKGFTLDYCPLCSLTCECAKCGRKRRSIALKLKKKCEEDNIPVSDVPLQILPLCDEATSAAAAANYEPLSEQQKERVDKAKVNKGKVNKVKEEGTGSKHGRAKNSSPNKKDPFFRNIATKVKKVPIEDFPTEMHDGKNLDPSLPDDYRTKFLPTGTYPTKPLPVDETKVLKMIDEASSSMEYCIKCDSDKGSLINCQTCPRSYCKSCINLEGNVDFNSFKCERCDLDNIGDVIDIELKGDMDSCPSLKLLDRLSEILMNYDFGDIFKVPVDTKQVSDYLSIVKDPMDLGTIRSNISDEEYIKRATSVAVEHAPKDIPPLHLLFLEILKTFELVWHNCFLYNLAGTLYYRMATVQSKKYEAIKKQNIDPYLHPYVLQQIEEYKAANEVYRDEIERKFMLTRRSKHIIQGYSTGSRKKAIAVYDPEEYMITKLYSCTNSAFNAAKYMQEKLHHPSEFAINRKNFQDLIEYSSTEPTKLLFGHRWMLVDTLRGGFFTLADADLEDRAIIKYCPASFEIICQYVSKEDAYEDWKRMIKLPGVAVNVEKNDIKSFADEYVNSDINTFSDEYVNSNKTIEGVSWSSIEHYISLKSKNNEDTGTSDISERPCKKVKIDSEDDIIALKEQEQMLNAARLFCGKCSPSDAEQEILAIELATLTVVKRFADINSAVRELKGYVTDESLLESINECRAVGGFLYVFCTNESELLKRMHEAKSMSQENEGM